MPTTSTTSKCQHAIDRMPQHPANAKKPVCEECGQPLVTKICPKCGGELPLNIGTAKSYPIAIIGAKETGKSNYVAVLINQLKNDIALTMWMRKFVRTLQSTFFAKLTLQSLTTARLLWF